MSEKLKVFIVDDSTVFRSQIRAALEGQDGIEVVGFATDGRMACEALKHKKVDVVTLDMEMPIMNGLETLTELAKQSEKPHVLVFSSHTRSGADATLKALQLGASDFLLKPQLDSSGPEKPADVIRSVLLPKILQFRPADRPMVTQEAVVPIRAHRFERSSLRSFSPRVLVIASSTGGPTALEKFFEVLRPPLNCPILIVQHMPPIFTAALAERLTKVSGLTVREGVDGEVLQRDRVYIAPGNFHMRIVSRDGVPTISLDQSEQRNSVRPAADFLFETAADIYKNGTLGIVMTGMGADGAAGAVAIKEQGGRVFIQNKESCVVFGMPGAVSQENAFDLAATPADLARQVSALSICGFETERLLR